MISARTAFLRFARRQIPMASALAALVVDLLPLPDAAPETTFPLFLPVVVFYWSLRRPDLFTPLSVVLTGLLADGGGGLPPGTTGLALLAACSLAHGRERSLLAQPAPLLWGAFALFLAVFEAVRWAIVSVWDGVPRPPAPVLGEYLLTLILEPVLVRLLEPLERSVGRAPHAAGSR